MRVEERPVVTENGTILSSAGPSEYVCGKFIDQYGYESGLHKQSVVFDSTPPGVIMATLSPPVARSGETVVLAVTFHEPVAEHAEGALLSVVPAGSGTPDFQGPQRVGISNTYVWTSAIGALEEEDQDAYHFSLVTEDALGNASDTQSLLDDGGAPLELRIDAAPPKLVGAAVEFSSIWMAPRGKGLVT